MIWIFRPRKRRSVLVGLTLVLGLELGLPIPSSVDGRLCTATVAVAVAVAAEPVADLPPRAGRIAGTAAGLLPAHPGRIIVKYRGHVQGCVHCRFAAGIPFASETGDDHLDQLNRDLRVRAARPLVLPDVHGLAGERAAAWRDRLDTARQRSLARTWRRGAAAPAPQMSQVYVLDLPTDADVTAAAALYASDPDVEYAVPDLRREIDTLPDDPFLASSGTWNQPYPDLWGLMTTNAPAAWGVSTGAGVVVAIVDTGVNTKHKDLKANVWSNPGEIPGNHLDDDGNGFIDDVIGWDFVKKTSKPSDRHGHGTHVAGTVAATANNGIGVAGMAYDAKLMVVRGIDADGTGWSSDLAQGILYAAENGADVINNSWGGWFASNLIGDAVATASSLGTVVVFAEGNDGNRLVGDASWPQAIAVAATRFDDQRSTFSNYGSSTAIAAPGEDVLSTSGPSRVGGKKVKGPYRRLSGTSMAAPHVAGAAALVLANEPGLSPEEVRWHLEVGADQVGYPGYEGQAWNPYLGWGRLDAAAALAPLPITSRLRPLSLTFHGWAGAVEPAPAPVALGFTTRDPVAWTASGPPWLHPVLNGGSGSASLDLEIDATGETPGTRRGDVTISAPSAADGGTSAAATVFLHRDIRVGREIPVALDVRYLWQRPRVVGDPAGALVVFVGGDSGAPRTLLASRILPDGTASAPATIHESIWNMDEGALAAASDGATILFVWREHHVDLVGSPNRYRQTDRILAIRTDGNLQRIEAAPIEFASRTVDVSSVAGDSTRYTNVEVAHDGTAWQVLWEQIDSHTDLAQVFSQRVLPSGALAGGTTTLYPTATTALPQIVWPSIACAGGGQCAVAWVQSARESYNGSTGWVGRAVVTRLDHGAIVDATPITVLHPVDLGTQEVSAAIASDGSDYLVAAARNRCVPVSFCAFDAVAGRLTAAGNALEPDGILLNDDTAQPTPWILLGGLAFDGANYVATWTDANITTKPDAVDVTQYGWTIGYPLFAQRVSPAGAVLDHEPAGLLVSDRGTALSGEIVRAGSELVAAWVDTRSADPTGKSLYAQRISP